MILENDILRAELHPDQGARVSSLIDKRTGRDWLVPGVPPTGGTDYTPHAAGWDECWPTVAPCSHPFWGAMRDHGDLWGRPWRAEGRAMVYQKAAVRFERCLTLDGATLHADYAITASDKAPWMWSQHVLLALRPAETFSFSGIDHSPVPPVAGIGTGTAAKTYARVHGPARAVIGGPDGGIAFDWDGEEMPAFGLWRCYGGWPDAGPPAHQVALEPTTHTADDLASVISPRLGAATARWRISLHLTDGSPA